MSFDGDAENGENETPKAKRRQLQQRDWDVLNLNCAEALQPPSKRRVGHEQIS
jgi:hypothetical protein